MSLHPVLAEKLSAALEPVAAPTLTRRDARLPPVPGKVHAVIGMHRLHQDLKAQGHGIAKDAVHALLGHLMDAFLLSAVPLATESERQRNSNPRKRYPADPGLIKAFDASGRSNVGRALETAVLNELERRGAEIGYVKTPDGSEVDFLARHLGGGEELIQVSADVSATEMLVLDRDALTRVNAPGVEVQPAYEWLLAGSRER